MHDQLHEKALHFIRTSKDEAKIQELLDLIEDVDQRSELQEIWFKQQSKWSKASETGPRQLVNFTSESFKKYDNVKISKYL